MIIKCFELRVVSLPPPSMVFLYYTHYKETEPLPMSFQRTCRKSNRKTYSSDRLLTPESLKGQRNTSRKISQVLSTEFLKCQIISSSVIYSLVFTLFPTNVSFSSPTTPSYIVPVYIVKDIYSGYHKEKGTFIKLK